VGERGEVAGAGETSEETGFGGAGENSIWFANLVDLLVATGLLVEVEVGILTAVVPLAEVVGFLAGVGLLGEVLAAVGLLAEVLELLAAVGLLAEVLELLAGVGLLAEVLELLAAVGLLAEGTIFSLLLAVGGTIGGSSCFSS